MVCEGKLQWKMKTKGREDLKLRCCLETTRSGTPVEQFSSLLNNKNQNKIGLPTGKLLSLKT